MPAHSRQPERQNIIDRMHTWQQYSVTISENILTSKYIIFNLRDILSLSIDNNPNIIAGDWRQVIVSRMRESVHAITKLAHFWSDTRWFPPHASATLRGREAVLNAIVPTSPPWSQSCGIPARGVWCHMSLCTNPGIPILKIEHDKGKCTLFYCCFGHYRMLAYKTSACEVQKHSIIHCQSPSRGLGSQQWLH